MTETKSFPIAEFKAVDGEPEGTFTALVSVFGNVDHGGDIVEPGAFAKTLERYAEQGKRIPVIYSHDQMNLDHWVGDADPADAVETSDGLLVKARLDMEDRYGRKVHKLLDRRVLTEFSFSYGIVKSEENEHGGRNLKELELVEVGPTIRGMNPATELLAVKSFAAVEQQEIAPLVASLTDADRAAVERTSQLLGVQIDAGQKAGARLSKDTVNAITQAIDLLASLISADTADETPKSIEAQTNGHQTDGAVSDDSDLLTQLQLLKAR